MTKIKECSSHNFVVSWLGTSQHSFFKYDKELDGPHATAKEREDAQVAKWKSKHRKICINNLNLIVEMDVEYYYYE